MPFWIIGVAAAIGGFIGEAIIDGLRTGIIFAFGFGFTIAIVTMLDRQFDFSGLSWIIGLIVGTIMNMSKKRNEPKV